MRLQRVLVGMLEVITAGRTSTATRTTGGDTAMGVTQSFVAALACVEVGTAYDNDQRITPAGLWRWPWRQQPGCQWCWTRRTLRSGGRCV
jgi:hypothetical protein